MLKLMHISVNFFVCDILLPTFVVVTFFHHSSDGNLPYIYIIRPTKTEQGFLH
jgi:hypothetical protein